MKCKFCEYEWKEREKEPKACPRCKKRFDYPNPTEPHKSFNPQLDSKAIDSKPLGSDEFNNKGEEE